ASQRRPAGQRTRAAVSGESSGSAEPQQTPGTTVQLLPRFWARSGATVQLLPRYWARSRARVEQLRQEWGGSGDRRRRHPQHPAVRLHQAGVEAGRRAPQEDTEPPVERLTPAPDDLVAGGIQASCPLPAGQVVVVPVVGDAQQLER